jgi:hypothetical protein
LTPRLIRAMFLMNVREYDVMIYVKNALFKPFLRRLPTTFVRENFKFIIKIFIFMKEDHVIALAEYGR